MKKCQIRVAALVAALTLSASAAHADSISDYIHLEAAVGFNHYEKTSTDNVWLQEGMEHHTELSAPVLGLGLTGPIYTAENWGVDWHIDYMYLGHVDGAVADAEQLGDIF